MVRTDQLSESQGFTTLSDALGLSIGATNLVAIRDGRPPVSRRSILTLFRGRPPEVGAPGQYPQPDQPGLVLTSFVERVGDPVPIVAPDGSSHRAELVLVEALDALARAVGGGAPITIAFPAHWPPAVVGALRAAVRTKPGLNPNGVAPSFIPDASAALSGLRVSPGLPPNGTVVLCDLGGTGTSITFADATAGLAIVGPTVRHSDFSGDLIDQALLNHVVTGVAQSSDADPNSTAAVGSLVVLRDECRQAKERLSAETATAVRAELPGHQTDFRLTRDELERLVDRPLSGLVDAIADALNRYRIPPSNVSAVATIGGGAAIPLVTQKLSERLRTSVVTTPTPLLSTAVGALIVADRGLSPDTPTGLAPAADAATGMAPTTGWVPDGGATQMAPAEGAPTSSAPQLAWSQDDAAGGDPQPYAGDDYESTYSGPTDARPAMVYAHDEEDDQPDEAPPLPWYRRPPILLGAAAAALLLAAGGLAITLTSSSEPSTPVTATATSYTTDSNGNTVPVLPPHSESQLVTITKPNGETSTSVAPPATTTATTSSTTDSTTTTTTSSTTSTTTTTTTSTTTTAPPTTTQPTTTAPPSTTTQPPSTTNSPPPSTATPKPSTSAAVPAAATPSAAPAALPEVTIPVLAPQAP